MTRHRMLSLAAVFLVCSLLLAGCGSSAPAPLTLEKDLGLTVQGDWFPIHQDAAPLLRVLGDHYELFAAPSCLFEGEDKEFDYGSLKVLTNPDGDRDLWYLASITTDDYPTARQIRVGSSVDEVVAAYGDKYYWESDYEMVYSISGVQGDLASPCIIFRLEGETVAAIDLYFPTNAG